MKLSNITKRLRMMLFLPLLSLGVQAQVTIVDGHYADLKQGMEANPTSNPDWSLMEGVTVKKAAQGKRGAPIAPATSYGLPDHVNNGANKYFRNPVANQAGNSCGITSRFAHMMAYELNAYRDKDGSLAENMLPAHFAFVPAYNEDPNKENYAKYVGIPDGATFGGTNYSSIYGGPYSEGGNNYGRMQGYENWHKAMFNRITDNPNFPLGAMTEEGALAWKRWLYNHNGDESFHAGGIIGIGLASSGLEYQAIGSTTANNNAGVTGLNYLTHWGTGVDHAMVVVGYDDRIEFDLDGNGTYGQTSNAFGQNETGAWIVANSWGSGWGNNGFLYVPYALGSPTSTTVTSGSYSGYKAGDTNGWTGEVYKIRKNYVPIRTLKAAVAYSKRSEIQICVGISTNLSATSPDKTLVLLNHNYHGDYNNGDGPNSTNVDADVPMLGQWTDGKLHTEAMEFGYDLTDFTAEFDQHKPLKYFLIINTKSGASGSGQIEYASIMDYELNPNGVETPFASKNVTITNNGGTTTISTIVYGEEVSGPDNLALSSTTLTWDAPQGTSYTPIGYNIYQDGSRIGTTTSRSFDIGSATGVFHVTASLYDINGAISESPASNLVITNMSSSNFITYIGDPITAVSQLTSGMYVVLKCYGRDKYVYDNGTSNIYPITSTAPEILAPDDYKYVFKVSKSNSTYTFQSVSGYLPATSDNMRPSNSAGSYTVALVSGSSDLFSLKNGSYYLNGGASNITRYSLDNNSKFYIIPVHVSIPGTNTLNVTIADPGTVYAGAPVQLSLEGAVDIASATWTVAGTNYTGVSPIVTFNGTGSKSVSCTATDSKGYSKSTSKSITVSAAPTATANFTLSSESTTGSDRISFISQNTLPGCTYSWSMPGAEETTATTRNASATYLTTGQKTVTLTVTDGNSNVYSHSETFMVNASAPKSRYTISPAIVVKNNPVTLTDNTLYDPTAWSWRFSSDNNTITYNGQNGTITPTKAGVYKLTFGTSNAVGTDFVEAERALIVCNSASGQGLTFAGGDQNVTASLSSALTTAWTIDFWFNPKSLGSTTQGITGSKNSNSFTITSDANGVATLSVGSQIVSTDAAFYISNEWHHYAITFGSSTVKFYRDGSLISSKSISTSSFSNYFQNLKLGGSSAPMNGSIDEFRVWSTTLSQANIRSYCVAPISASTSGLKLYWQMNQSTGNVTDATSNNRTGTRNNFGPDGDAWTDSDGVFAIDFSTATTPTISATQLNHYYDNIYSVSDEQDGNLQRASLGMAFDGNTSTYYQSRWETGSYLSEASYPHSFILRRAALHEVSAISIVSNTTPTNWSHNVPSASYGRAKYFTIEESDDALIWDYVDKNVRLYDLATNNVVLPWPITKEYVRFSFAEPLYTDNEYVALLINEMNFYGTAVEPEKTKVPLTYMTCSDESTISGDERPGSNALDGDASTFWHSSWYGTAVEYPHSITVSNLPEGKIDLFKFYQQHSNSGNQNGSFRAGVLNVETSDDNSTWTTAFTGLRIPYGNTGYVKLPESIDAPYIRLTFTRNQSDIGAGTYLTLNEIEAYGVANVEPQPAIETTDVKIVYGNNAETTYGSWNSNTWTSNNESGLAGLTLTKSGGTFYNYGNVTGYKDLDYYTGGTETLTLTAPTGYIIISYSAKVRQANNSTASYTLTTSGGQNFTPPYANAIEGYLDMVVNNVNSASTTITVVNTNASNVMGFVNFVVAVAPDSTEPTETYSDIKLPASCADNLETDIWYVMYNRGYYRNYLYENESNQLYNTTSDGHPGLVRSDSKRFLIRLSDAGNGKYYIETGRGNFVQALSTTNGTVATTGAEKETFTIAKIKSTDGHFYVQGANNVILDCSAASPNDAGVVSWGTTVPTETGGNNDWAFYPVTLVPHFAPTSADIFTINNTNSYRGALMSAPSQSEKWLWSSGKNDQTYDATSANCQWLFVPTGTEDQYYLYNVGKQKFIIPTKSGTYEGYSWMFSSDAVPVQLFLQSDGTYKMNTVSGNIYLSVSNNYTGPIINYNDAGAQFTISKQGIATSEVSTQLEAAVAAKPSATKQMALNKVSEKSYATLYLDYDAQTDGNTKAYYITTTTESYATLTEVANEGRDIPAYTAVVLINENGTTNPTFSTGFSVSSGYAEAIIESSNLLKGTLTSMSLDLSDATNYYSLGRKDGVIGFYKFDNGTTTITLGANKAYLDTPTPINSVKGFTFSFDDANSIVSPLGETEEGASIYNLSGQRLSKPQKGINIINGKKVLIK